ncbi:transposase [Actinomadura darangshiensis]|uniref:Transposase n=1 Tax=Actinomadura darangshiensis TaxID=705336 RepID=A0A4R5AG52_9ACTN|nr:transposase [Actinomadura darangshiensis]TDD70595.1 transposase [Actinomadura darangshiensis]
MTEELLKRHDPTDAEWERSAPLLPGHPRRGGRWHDHKTVIKGIFFRTTSTPWRDLPARYGNWKTVCNRYRRWSLDGTWTTILSGLQPGCDDAEGTQWTVPADSTINRAHQHAAGARHASATDYPSEGRIE